MKPYSWAMNFSHSLALFINKAYTAEPNDLWFFFSLISCNFFMYSIWFPLVTGMITKRESLYPKHEGLKETHSHALPYYLIQLFCRNAVKM